MNDVTPDVPLWLIGSDVDGFLMDMGRVLELKNAVAAAKFGTDVHVRTFAAADVAIVAQIARRQLIVAFNKVWPEPLKTFPLSGCSEQLSRHIFYGYKRSHTFL